MVSETQSDPPDTILKMTQSFATNQPYGKDSAAGMTEADSILAILTLVRHPPR